MCVCSFCGWTLNLPRSHGLNYKSNRKKEIHQKRKLIFFFKEHIRFSFLVDLRDLNKEKKILQMTSD